jgi:hypothetical protein
MGALLPAEHRFRRAGIGQQFLPPVGSFLGDVFHKHGGAGAPELDVETYISHVNAARTVLQMREQIVNLRSELERTRQRLAFAQTRVG